MTEKRTEINGIKVEFRHRTRQEVAALMFEYLNQTAEREGSGGDDHSPKSNNETP